MLNAIKKLFAKKTPVAKTIATIEQFPALSVDERMRQIIFCGDTGSLVYYPLMKFAILNDVDPNVKMAGLKRIHLFSNEPDVVPFVESLKDHINIKGVEQYYSMALSRLQIISPEEFKRRADNGFIA